MNSLQTYAFIFCQLIAAASTTYIFLQSRKWLTKYRDTYNTLQAYHGEIDRLLNTEFKCKALSHSLDLFFKDKGESNPWELEKVEFSLSDKKVICKIPKIMIESAKRHIESVNTDYQKMALIKLWHHGDDPLIIIPN